jgi:cysteine desulfuration protein SufE
VKKISEHGGSADERQSDLPEPMADIVSDFRSVSERDRLQLLLDFSRELPELPPHLQEHRDAMEPVPECQSPVFLLVDVGADGRVHLYFDVPKEAPTTRGFAGILREGLEGLTPADVLAIPEDVPERLGVGSAVSPLRLRGMAGMLARIKRQVRAKQPAA